MESLSLLSVAVLGTLSSIIVQILKRPELDWGFLERIKTGKVAIFVVCTIGVIGVALWTMPIDMLLLNWQVIVMNLVKTLVSAFIAYKMIIEQLGI